MYILILNQFLAIHIAETLYQCQVCKNILVLKLYLIVYLKIQSTERSDY